MEKQTNRKEIYNGKVIKVVVDDVIIDDNTPSKREIVLHNGGACIAIKDSDGKYYMVKQYRYVHSQEMLEFCAGKIELNENPDDAVIREAKEETGCIVKNVRKFGYIIPTCGYSSEKIYLYYGEVDSVASQNLDIDERINVTKHSFKEIKDMILDGTITDAKTIACMYHIENLGIDKWRLKK